jgi:hypothetical protein
MGKYSKPQENWTKEEEELLLKCYSTSTILELCNMFPGRSQFSINSKIRHLKRKGKLMKNTKDPNAISRAISQNNYRT